MELIITTEEKLKQHIDEVVAKRFDDFLNKINVPQPSEYISRREVAEMLNITTATVDNWANKGRIKPSKIGGRVFYKRGEIEESFKMLNQ